jgi:DNA-binding FadR family transcriptional regulator
MPESGHKVRLEWTMHLVRLAGQERILLKERRQLVDWCRLTNRVELKQALRAEIAKIDEELRQLNGDGTSLVDVQKLTTSGK